MLPPLVADMDIAAPVVHFLRAQGVDVLSAREEGWGVSVNSFLDTLEPKIMRHQPRHTVAPVALGPGLCSHAAR